MRETALYSTIDDAQLLALEEAAFAAWPAAEVALLDGWRLRASAGVTRRANSVWPARMEGDLPLEARIAAVEDFYAQRNLPATFQLNSGVLPRDLDAHLAQRGYQIHAPTLVQSAPLATILERTTPLRHLPHLEVEIDEQFDGAWFATYASNEEHDSADAAGRAAILQRVPAPVAFVSAYIEGARVGVALGVISGAHLGIACMSTAPAARRRGTASAILRVLAIWGQMQDAKTAYLQVVADNAPAMALYARAGFTTAYSYHYRVRGGASA